MPIHLATRTRGLAGSFSLSRPTSSVAANSVLTPPPVALTKNADTYKYGFIWSPDSKKILWNDQQKRLNCVDVASGNMMVIAKSVTGEINDFTWSSDSKWVSYSDSKVGQKNILYLYEMSTAKITPITTQWYDSYSPSFSSDDKYLFFISDRDFNPTYSNTEWNHSYSDMSKIYFVTLAANTTSRFAPVNVAVAITNSEENKPAPDDKTKDAKKKDEPKAAASKDVKVDLDGIQNRIGVLPISASRKRDRTESDTPRHPQRGVGGWRV